jgi:hypothetical protein
MRERPIIGVPNAAGDGPHGTLPAQTQVREAPDPKSQATGLPDWDLEPPMRLMRRGSE